MSGSADRVTSRGERLQRVLLMGAALVLFALGLLLLMAPARSQDSRLTPTGDNGVHRGGVTACTECMLL